MNTNNYIECVLGVHNAYEKCLYNILLVPMSGTYAISDMVLLFEMKIITMSFIFALEPCFKCHCDGIVMYSFNTGIMFLC